MIKFRQLILPGEKGRDVKAVKDALKRMKTTNSEHLNKSDKAGKTFVECIKVVQKHHGLKVDGIYGPSTHCIIAPHFSLFDLWRYRTAKIRKHRESRNPFSGGWIPNRLDMGFDGTFSGQILAPFDGVITYTTGYNESWRGGIVQIKANIKPHDLPTDTLYFAEGLRPIVSAGTHVPKGHPIAVEAPSGWGNVYGTTSNGVGQIEWGVAAHGIMDQYVNTYAIELGLGSIAARDMVLNFARWAESLGCKPPTQTWNAGNS